MQQSRAVQRTVVTLTSPAVGRAGAGGHPCQGIYHVAQGHQPRIAVIATHYNVDFSEHYLADYLARRGLGFLGWNTRFRGDEPHFLLDHALVDLGVGVRWLREQAGIETVVLLGNSGGGSLMAAYQSQAVEPNIGPVADMRPAAGLEDIQPGNAYISIAAHVGRPDVLTDWMDAAVVDEFDPVATDPSLDLWLKGPPFDPEFLGRYRQAQVARNHRITAWVRDELARMSAAGLHDRMFSVPRTWADPRMVDPTIEPTNRRPNWCYAGEPRRANRSVWGIASSVSLRTWLSLWGLETSQARAQPHLARVTVPSLVINGDADTGVFPSDAAKLYEAIAASDKQEIEIAGDHYFLEPDGARDALADRVVAWLEERFSM